MVKPCQCGEWEKLILPCLQALLIEPHGISQMNKPICPLAYIPRLEQHENFVTQRIAVTIDCHPSLRRLGGEENVELQIECTDLHSIRQLALGKDFNIVEVIVCEAGS